MSKQPLRLSKHFQIQKPEPAQLPEAFLLRTLDFACKLKPLLSPDLLRQMEIIEIEARMLMQLRKSRKPEYTERLSLHSKVSSKQNNSFSINIGSFKQNMDSKNIHISSKQTSTKASFKETEPKLSRQKSRRNEDKQVMLKVIRNVKDCQQMQSLKEELQILRQNYKLLVAKLRSTEAKVRESQQIIKDFSQYVILKKRHTKLQKEFNDYRTQSQKEQSQLMAQIGALGSIQVDQFPRPERQRRSESEQELMTFLVVQAMSLQSRLDLQNN